MHEKAGTEALIQKSVNIRRNIIRMLSEAGSGHTGGSLGLADVFCCLYHGILNHNPVNPDLPERDRLVLSIGHVAPVLYATLAEAGFFHEEELLSLRKLGSRLQGHPGRDQGLPGIEVSSGSLGQGLSVACGMALAAKIREEHHRIVCVMGDGEIQEGSVWEAAMAAAHHKLDNITAIIDRNGLQIDGSTAKVMDIEPLEEKWTSFGWYVENCDGHNHEDIFRAFSKAKQNKGKPTVVIAKTIMGKGIPEIENNYCWHGKAPDKIQAEKFLTQLVTL
jgi:transketolase